LTCLPPLTTPTLRPVYQEFISDRASH